MTRYAIDADTERLRGSAVVLGGSPRRLFRLTPAGTASYDTIAAGGDAQPDALARRLVAAGAIHPAPAPAPERLSETTLVIPAHGADPAVLAALVDSVPAAAAIVVDDASAPPITPVAGADMIRRNRNGGPAAARNTGLRHATTEFVAFVDDDVLAGVDPEWLPMLLGHFDDDCVGLVAPRVAAAASPGVLGAYESGHSALDMGERPALVGLGSRISYVPAAAIVVRHRAVAGIGGFDEAIRLGEDVDMVWRLAAAGWACRYEPAAVVFHRPRTTWRAWARQRFGYGASAAPLADRHSGALPAVRISPWSAAVLMLAAAGARRAAAGVVVTATALLAWRIHRLRVPAPSATAVAARLSIEGHLQAARQVGWALRRPWWPFAIAGCAVSPRARLVTAAAMAASALDVRAARWVPVRVVDDLVYGAGIWSGVVRCRQVAPLLPSYRRAS